MYKIRQFGALMREEQIEILKAFQDQEDEILFPYCDPELEGLTREKEKELVERLADDTVEDYFEETIYIYDEKLIENIDSKIKKEVYEYVRINTDVEGYSFNDLMNRINKGDLDKINKTLAAQIKYIISYELNVNNYNKVQRQQMKERMVFKNKIMFDEEGEDRLETDVWWYCIDDDEELWKEMNSSWGIGMVVTNRNRRFELYSYVLVCSETAEDYDLLIYANGDNEFEEIVMPKISEINKEIIGFIEKC